MLGSGLLSGVAVHRLPFYAVIQLPVDEDVYDGIQVDELPITAADVPDPAHLRRSTRYPGARDVDPDAAVEAALDPDGLLARDSSSRTREAILVVGIRRPPMRCSWSFCSPTITRPRGCGMSPRPGQLTGVAAAPTGRGRINDAE